MTEPRPIESVPPVQRDVAVSWSPEVAFHRFTAEFGRWWPIASHSVGGPAVKAVHFECRVGGRILEEHHDGRRFLWGEVRELDAPRRVVFTWHPSREPDTAQTVEVRFDPEGTGTRVTLTSWGWDRLGARAKGTRRGYDMGWRWVLNYWAGQGGAWMRMMGVLMAVAQGLSALRGGHKRSIARAGGTLPRTG